MVWLWWSSVIGNLIAVDNSSIGCIFAGFVIFLRKVGVSWFNRLLLPVLLYGDEHWLLDRRFFVGRADVSCETDSWFSRLLLPVLLYGDEHWLLDWRFFVGRAVLIWQAYINYQRLFTSTEPRTSVFLCCLVGVEVVDIICECYVILTGFLVTSLRCSKRMNIVASDPTGIAE